MDLSWERAPQDSIDCLTYLQVACLSKYSQPSL